MQERLRERYRYDDYLDEISEEPQHDEELIEDEEYQQYHGFGGMSGMSM